MWPLRSLVFIFNCVCFLASCPPYSRLCLSCKHVASGHTMNKIYKPQVFVGLLVQTWLVASPLLWAMLTNMQQPGEELHPIQWGLEPSPMLWSLSWGCLVLVFCFLVLSVVMTESFLAFVPQFNRDNSCSTHILARMKECSRGLVAF